MAFLNNSGDIILDAVLTDLGRKRLSQGDGSFKISQFALGDDEIDYSQYNLSTGSAYQDLDILQTPVLEAISDNVASMKSKLVTYSDTSLLYLPIQKLATGVANGFQTSSIGSFFVTTNTRNEFLNSGDTSSVFGIQNGAGEPANGTIFGRATGPRTSFSIVVHQGLDTTQVSFTNNLDTTLTETDYFLYIDDRLGKLLDRNGNPLPISYIDDDNIATYVVSQADNAGAFLNVENPQTSDTSSPSAIAGPYNRQALSFSIYATDNLTYSDFLFEKFGNTSDTSDSAVYTSVYSIDSEVRVVGAKTGYSLSIPLRFVKVKTF